MRMDPRHLARLLLTTALAVLLFAACGGDAQKDDYLDGLRGVKRHLDAASKASLESGSATKPDERSAKLEAAHDELEEAADAASELDPPDDAASAHEDFADALHDYADLYEQLATLEPGDPDEAQLYGEAGKIAKRLTTASRRLEKAGYKLPGASKQQDQEHS
jgi:hypothetical protein